MPSDYSGSSIPIPDGLVREVRFHAPGAPVADYRDVVEVADLPKLYAHWAERLAAKLDELRLHDDTGDPRDEGYMACLADVMAALGLGEQA